ncbi:hypothetical protein ElyMa_000859700 [Elysia marginata]|uniref:Uncharacterized protein n=1 Tax=Elysia marginata TaxID=1093978 RepID=A0AAV4H1N6_9GAST|nr:hypothetical protein ElyMa_000859700 [Elysia marginata]
MDLFLFHFYDLQAFLQCFRFALETARHLTDRTECVWGAGTITILSGIRNHRWLCPAPLAIDIALDKIFRILVYTLEGSGLQDER